MEKVLKSVCLMLLLTTLTLGFIDISRWDMSTLPVSDWVMDVAMRSNGAQQRVATPQLP